MSTVDENTKTYGIVELMGHKVVAGEISKSEMLGKPLLRVDVPETSGYPAFTQFYGEAAIYCVTFTSEEVARLTANQVKLNPISVYTPDLITREQHDKTIRLYKDQIERMNKGLPSGADADEDDPDLGSHDREDHEF